MRWPILTRWLPFTQKWRKFVSSEEESYTVAYRRRRHGSASTGLFGDHAGHARIGTHIRALSLESLDCEAVTNLLLSPRLDQTPTRMEMRKLTGTAHAILQLCRVAVQSEDVCTTPNPSILVAALPDELPTVVPPSRAGSDVGTMVAAKISRPNRRCMWRATLSA